MTERKTADAPLVRARELALAAQDRRARDVLILDVAGLTGFADAFVICSGTSDRHVRAVADAVLECSRDQGEKALGVEGYDEGDWVLIDLNDVIVHVFHTRAREHYDLERLWGDAPSELLGDPEDDAVEAPGA